MITLKSKLTLCAALLGLAVSHADALQLTFSGSSSTSGPLGNTRVFSTGGITVTASAESLIGNVAPWQASYLGIYSGGLGVTNSAEGTGGSGTHTADNLSSNDRVVFSFSTAVIFDKVGLTQFGDTDISLYYYSGGSWALLENNPGGAINRTADVNAGAVFASLWAVGALYPASVADDSFKISSITFNQPTQAPPATVPDAGGSLLLLAIAMGILVRFQRQTATC